MKRHVGLIRYAERYGIHSQAGVHNSSVVDSKT